MWVRCCSTIFVHINYGLGFYHCRRKMKMNAAKIFRPFFSFFLPSNAFMQMRCFTNQNKKNTKYEYGMLKASPAKSKCIQMPLKVRCEKNLNCMRFKICSDLSSLHLC